MCGGLAFGVWCLVAWCLACDCWLLLLVVCGWLLVVGCVCCVYCLFCVRVVYCAYLLIVVYRFAMWLIACSLFVLGR